jgi:hypothetical protein
VNLVSTLRTYADGSRIHTKPDQPWVTVDGGQSSRVIEGRTPEDALLRAEAVLADPSRSPTPGA